MRSILLTVVTAALVIGAFVVASAATTSGGSSWMDRLGRPLGVEASPVQAPAAPLPTVLPQISTMTGPVRIDAAPGLEGLHARHGRVGQAMKGILELTIGTEATAVSRERMQEYLHQLKYSWTADDVPYMIDVFKQTSDPTFRKWFPWIVRQVPDERFVDVLSEVYPLDPIQAVDALAAIGKPKAIERISGLAENQSDPELRRHAYSAISHVDWDGRDPFFAGIAEDAKRPDIDRVQALVALGQTGQSHETLDLLMRIATGSARPVKLSGQLAADHPIADMRSAAIMGVMFRGDVDSARRLLDLADQPGVDADFVKLVDQHLAAFQGPDLTEVIYARTARRGMVSSSEILLIARDRTALDRARLATLRPLARDQETRDLLDRVLR